MDLTTASIRVIAYIFLNALITSATACEQIKTSTIDKLKIMLPCLDNGEGRLNQRG